MRHIHTLLVSSALIVVAVASTFAPAGAQPVEHGRFHDVFSEEFVCDDLTTRLDIDVRGMFLLQSRGPNGALHLLEALHGSASWTNPTNDKSYTLVFNGVDNDLEVTDNGDGTITILVMETGSGRWYGPDGKLLFHESGQVRYEIVVDLAGTPTDPTDDEIVDFRLIKGPTGRWDTVDRDFCEDLRALVG